jgi:hypothetical protein
MSSSEQQLETVEGRKSCANNNQPCTKATPSCLAAPKSMGEPEQQQHVLTTLSKKTNYASYQLGRSEFLIVHPTRTQARSVEVSAVSLHYDAKFNLVALFDYFDFLHKDRRCV